MSRRAALRRAARGDDLDPGLAAAERALDRISTGGPLGLSVPMTRERFRESEQETRRRDTKPSREARAAESQAKAKAARKARRKGRGR